MPNLYLQIAELLQFPNILLYLLYKLLSGTTELKTPEEILQAAVSLSDKSAVKALEHFITFLARVSGDFAMGLQAHGGVYLAGGIVPSIIKQLQSGHFRKVFDDHGRIAEVIYNIPVYVIMDKFPAFKGCMAALSW